MSEIECIHFGNDTSLLDYVQNDLFDNCHFFTDRVILANVMIVQNTATVMILFDMDHAPYKTKNYFYGMSLKTDLRTGSFRNSLWYAVFRNLLFPEPTYSYCEKGSGGVICFTNFSLFNKCKYTLEIEKFGGLNNDLFSQMYFSLDFSLMNEEGKTIGKRLYTIPCPEFSVASPIGLLPCVWKAQEEIKNLIKYYIDLDKHIDERMPDNLKLLKEIGEENNNENQ